MFINCMHACIIIIIDAILGLSVMGDGAPMHAEGNELMYCVNLINSPDSILDDIANSISIEYIVTPSPMTASELLLCI